MRSPARIDSYRELWLFICGVGLLGFNWPTLDIFKENIVLYLFIFWGIFILGVAFATKKQGQGSRVKRSKN